MEENYTNKGKGKDHDPDFGNGKVLVAGYFDPIHPGHVEQFHFAKHYGYVVVATHPIEHILKKSPFYVYTLEERVSLISSFRDCVDEVVVCKAIDVAEIILDIRPRFFIKGNDYSPDNLPQCERVACNMVGCTVIYQDDLKINSSTQIKNRIITQLLDSGTLTRKPL